nr:hypothetical protein CFP56_07681 [Quercus suber]
MDTAGFHSLEVGQAYCLHPFHYDRCLGKGASWTCRLRSSIGEWGHDAAYNTAIAFWWFVFVGFIVLAFLGLFEVFEVAMHEVVTDAVVLRNFQPYSLSAIVSCIV